MVVKTKVSSNFFWHSTRKGDEVYVQEYGIPPTGIYVSENCRNWRLLNTNLQLDEGSKHAHARVVKRHLGVCKALRVCRLFRFQKKRKWENA